MTIGERIKTLRNQKNLTQKELALKINKSPQVISNWERGYTQTVNYDDLDALASVFDVSVEYLLGKTDSRKDNILELVEQISKQQGMSPEVFEEATRRIKVARKQLFQQDIEHQEKEVLAQELKNLAEQLSLEDLKFLKTTAEHLRNIKKTPNEQSATGE